MICSFTGFKAASIFLLETEAVLDEAACIKQRSTEQCAEPHRCMLAAMGRMPGFWVAAAITARVNMLLLAKGFKRTRQMKFRDPQRSRSLQDSCEQVKQDLLDEQLQVQIKSVELCCCPAEYRDYNTTCSCYQSRLFGFNDVNPVIIRIYATEISKSFLHLPNWFERQGRSEIEWLMMIWTEKGLQPMVA